MFFYSFKHVLKTVNIFLQYKILNIGHGYFHGFDQSHELIPKNFYFHITYVKLSWIKIKLAELGSNLLMKPIFS
jgi:hypothetical protein